MQPPVSPLSRGKRLAALLLAFLCLPLAGCGRAPAEPGTLPAMTLELNETETAAASNKTTAAAPESSGEETRLPEEASSEQETTSEPETAPTEASAPETTAPPQTSAAPETALPDTLARQLKKAGMTEDELDFEQLLVVTGGEGSLVDPAAAAAYASNATASLYVYEKTGNGWQTALFSGPVFAYVGRSGIGAAHEGSGMSPAGCYALPEAFGRASVSECGTRLPYFQVTPYDFWVDDPSSPYYNQHVDSRQVSGWQSAENLQYFVDRGDYVYAVYIAYNRDPIVPGNGSAFFVHVYDRPSSGCVGLSEDAMRSLFGWLNPACDPHILLIAS